MSSQAWRLYSEELYKMENPGKPGDPTWHPPRQRVIPQTTSSGHPSTAPLGHHSTSRMYFRKADIADGVELKSSFSDVAFGGNSDATITGGAKKSIFYSTYTIPDKAKYGESNLTNLYSVLPVTNIVRRNLTTEPQLKIWKGSNKDFTEGSNTIDPSTVLAFMSSIDVEEDIVEAFNGGGSQMTKRIGNSTSFSMGESYLPAEWAWDNMTGRSKVFEGKDAFFDDYCETIANGELVCKVQERTQWIQGTVAGFFHYLGNAFAGGGEPLSKRKYTDYVPIKTTFGLDPNWSYESVSGAGYPLSSYTETVYEDVTSSSDINRLNSLFEIHTNNNPWKDGDGKDVFRASATYSNEKVLTGAYSAKLSTFYANTTLKTSGEFPDPKDSGATNRQEVMMQYGPLPMPTALDMYDSGTNETAYRIEWDMFIDQLTPAYNTGTSGIDEDRLVRGFCFTISDTKHTANDGTLYDWIKAKQDGNDEEFAYFFIWKTTQNSDNAGDADHSIVCLGNTNAALGSGNFDEDSSAKMIRVHSGIDPFETAGLDHTEAEGIPSGEWLHCDVTTMPSTIGYKVRIGRQTANGEEERLAVFQMKTASNTYMDTLENWTPYIQLWVVNYPADTSENLYSSKEDTECTVFIDNFRVSNSNYRIQNATICDENTAHESLEFNSNLARNNNNATFQAPRILSLGVFDEADYPDDSVTNFFFSGFASDNPNDTGAMADAGLDVAWSAYSTAGTRLNLGWPMATGTNGVHTNDSTMAFTDGSGTNVGLTVGGTIGSLSHSSGSGTEVGMTGATGVEGFSQPGILQVDFADSDYSNFAKIKRENHFVKARVTEIVEVSTTSCTVRVDKPNIFNIPSISPTASEPFQFRMYLHNGTFGIDNTPTSGLRDMTLKSIDGDLVTLIGNASVDDDGDALLTIGNQPAICISPLAYWLCFYFNWHDGTDELPMRTYNSVTSVNKTVAAGITSGNYGATWNESKYTDTTTYDNAWNWSKTEGSVLNVDTDYGYGAYDTETKKGGYAGIFSPRFETPTGSATTDVCFNVADISGIVSVENLKADDIVPLAFMPADELSLHSVTVNTDDASAGVRPFLLAGFTDPVSDPPALTVKPYSADATKMEFNWTANAKDYWYGFLIIDDEPIFNKYHKAGLHIPNFYTLESYDGNKDIASGTSSGLKYYNYVENTTNDLNADSTFDIDFEGICGLTPAFDGDAYIRADADDMEISSAQPTTNMTIMAHVRINSSNTSKEIMSIEDNSNNVAFKLEVASGLKFKATVAPASGTAVELTSTTTILPDNETPYAICVTLDTEIANGNVKLFVNGRLEDQSGALTSAGSSDNWKSGQTWDDPSNGYVYLGNDDSNNGFTGTIEEVVISHRTFYPVVISDGSFVLDKNFSELVADSTGTSKSFNARLVLCDYHNISGKSTTEVAMSAPVSVRKAAFKVRGD